MLERGISVIIPSWNGRELLRACLPSVEAALARWGGTGEVIVVDDASADGTVDWIARTHPDTRIELQPRRRGFVHAANAGFAAARFAYSCLLNNDMTVEPDFFGPLAARLDADARVFAVSARSLEAGTGRINIGRRVRRLENNEIAGAGEERDDPDVGHTYFASGGASLFRTEIVRALGGFDTMYAPFYTEDADMSYRAWKRGYVVLHEPRAVAHHLGSASIGKKNAGAAARFFNNIRVSTIIHRNAVLFYTKNFTDDDLWRTYRGNIRRWGASSVLRLRFTYMLGILASLPRQPRARAARVVEKQQAVISDRELFEILNTDYHPPADS